MIFVPPRFAADAIYEAADAGIGTVVCITEGIPALDMLGVYTYLRPSGIAADRAELPRRAHARQRQGRHHARPGVREAGSVGLVSRSGTLTYEIAAELTGLGLGQLDDRGHRRRPDGRHAASSTSWSCSRPTPTPSGS